MHMRCENRHEQGKEDVFTPVILCAGCSQPILKFGDGNAIWQPEFGNGDEAFYAAKWPVAFVHKGACDRQFPGGRYYWMPLEDFIVYLGRNLGMDIPNESADRRGS